MSEEKPISVLLKLVSPQDKLSQMRQIASGEGRAEGAAQPDVGAGDRGRVQEGENGGKFERRERLGHQNGGRLPQVNSQIA